MLWLFFLCGCSSFGEITGHIISAETEEPLKNVQIILCKVEEGGREDVCTLQSAPTGMSDANGAFSISKIQAGNYILLHGYPDELRSTPDKWTGIEVPNPAFDLSRTGEISIEAPSAFWENGVRGTNIASEFITHDGKLVLNNGTIISEEFRISVMVVEMKMTPIVSVERGETTSIDWRVIGR